MPLTGTFVERKKTRVGCRTIQLFLCDAPKQLNRVVVAFFPQHRVEPPEKSAQIVVPTPNQVVANLEQTSELGR